MTGPLLHRQCRWTLVLAAVASATAVSMSALSGWQRGGWYPERFVWVAIGVVLVINAHLLPALCRGAPMAVRCVGGVLWAACKATACFGHGTFFLLAQQHAGQDRAASLMPVVTAVPSASGRSMTAIMTERAKVTNALAIADARRCTRDCPALQVSRVSIAARLEALDAEADEARRRQVADDRDAARREALLGDPVTTRLATMLGTTVTHIDLFSGLGFAALLEGVACLLWAIALRSLPAVAVAPLSHRVH
ncbi:hypothetical protein [Paraburkholderia sp.]|uniref:hypothetical protein n=1 Tax=Paraburkholderia sp. TaxID=1926495 RepID=UPI003C7B55D7